MKYRSLVVFLQAILLVLTLSGFAATAGSPPAQKTVLPAGSEQAQTQPPKPESKESKEKGTALTGCMDEQEGHYVLIDARNLSPIANLEADGFPTESFAKHLGHKVTVRGISSSGGARLTFKVRSIETVSESCEPDK
jgi:hypothetical protein